MVEVGTFGRNDLDVDLILFLASSIILVEKAMTVGCFCWSYSPCRVLYILVVYVYATNHPHLRLFVPCYWYWCVRAQGIICAFEYPEILHAEQSHIMLLRYKSGNGTTHSLLLVLGFGYKRNCVTTFDTSFAHGNIPKKKERVSGRRQYLATKLPLF